VQPFSFTVNNNAPSSTSLMATICEVPLIVPHRQDRQAELRPAVVL
jgi:hypothetical protein